MDAENKIPGPENTAGDDVAYTQDRNINADSRVSRRRALLAGLVATPAILTLMRRPVWAQTLEVSEALCQSLEARTSLHGDNREELLAACENRDQLDVPQQRLDLPRIR
jgi:hypothetical protein